MSFEGCYWYFSFSISYITINIESDTHVTSINLAVMWGLWVRARICILGVDLRPLACWVCELESRRRHGYSSLVSVVSYQAEISATARSLVQKSRTECGVSECVGGTSLRSSRHCSAVESWEKIWNLAHTCTLQRNKYANTEGFFGYQDWVGRLVYLLQTKLPRQYAVRCI